MKLSLIVPVYNVAPYLRACVDSVVSQVQTREPRRANGGMERLDVEIVCVDDGSTDGGGAMLDGARPTISSSSVTLRVIHQTHAGVGAARNAALAVATGDWIAFLDADDVLLPGALDRMSAWMADGRYDGILFGDPIEFRETPPAQCGGSGRILASIDSPALGRSLLFRGEPLWGYPVIRLLRRSVFGDLRFPEDLANLEDSLSLLDVLATPARWLRVDERLYGYRHRADSACRRITVGKLRAILPAFTRMHEQSRGKLGLSEREGRRLLRQYRDAIDYYLGEVFPTASFDELREVSALYAAHVRAVGIQTASVTVRLRLALAARFRTRFGFRLLALLYKLPRTRLLRRVLKWKVP